MQGSDQLLERQKERSASLRFTKPNHDTEEENSQQRKS